MKKEKLLREKLELKVGPTALTLTSSSLSEKKIRREDSKKVGEGRKTDGEVKKEEEEREKADDVDSNKLDANLGTPSLS
jgi:hypothetical protein